MAIGDGYGTAFLRCLCFGGPDVDGEGLVAHLSSKPRVMHPQILVLYGLGYLIYFAEDCDLSSSAFLPFGLLHSTWAGQLAS